MFFRVVDRAKIRLLICLRLNFDVFFLKVIMVISFAPSFNFLLEGCYMMQHK